MSGARFSLEEHTKLLTIDQVAALFGLSREAIYNRRHRNDFPPAIRVGAVLRWDLTEIEAWIDDRRESGQ